MNYWACDDSGRWAVYHARKIGMRARFRFLSKARKYQREWGGFVGRWVRAPRWSVNGYVGTAVDIDAGLIYQDRARLRKMRKVRALLRAAVKS